MPRFVHLADRLLQKIILRSMGYGHPVPKAALDAEYREGRWDHFDSPAEAPRYEGLAGLISGLFPSEPAVLDLGCGSGQLAARLQDRPLACYVGADLSVEGLARARRRNLPGAEFVEANFETWRPESAFDVIVFNESVGYARDPAKLVKEFARHLRLGGMILISQFRFGNHRALWRRVLRRGEVVRHLEVTGDHGRLVWDIRALRFPAANPPRQ
jgi:trans-aconitate methyltransferase